MSSGRVFQYLGPAPANDRSVYDTYLLTYLLTYTAGYKPRQRDDQFRGGWRPETVSWCDVRMISFLALLLLLHLLLLLLLVIVVVTRLFLPRDAMRKHSLWAVIRCPSVCLFVRPNRNPILALFSIYAYTLCRRTAKYDVVTHGDGHVSWVQPCITSQESRISALSNFRGSPLFLPTPFNAEWLNSAWWW